jgi:hypothetical protein
VKERLLRFEIIMALVYIRQEFDGKHAAKCTLKKAGPVSRGRPFSFLVTSVRRCSGLVIPNVNAIPSGPITFLGTAGRSWRLEGAFRVAFSTQFRIMTVLKHHARFATAEVAILIDFTV